MIIALFSRNMARLAKFRIIFVRKKTESASAKIILSFVRLAIFLQQNTIKVIFTFLARKDPLQIDFALSKVRFERVKSD